MSSRSGAILRRVTLASGPRSVSALSLSLGRSTSASVASASSTAGSSPQCRWFGSSSSSSDESSVGSRIRGSLVAHACGSAHRLGSQQSNGVRSLSRFRSRVRFGSPIPSASASFSSKASPDDEKSEGVVRGWMNERQARKEQEKYMEQMLRLSTMEVFTMENYREELQKGVESGGMLTKISFLQTKEIKQAREVVEVVDKIIEVVGPDATAEDLLRMDRMQRLRVANAASKTLEEIAIMVSQITNMDVMQKTLRKRHLEGKPIPPDKETMQAVIQKDALSVLSKSQKEMMRSRQESNARRMARKRRR